ncbi:MAG: metallophosphoesterase family protein [Longimicrobiales bacterium]
MRIGLISDTHGKLRRQVFTAFEDVDRILHAGDIGEHDLLVELEAIAPVTAVYGNTDRPEVRQHVEEVAELDAAGHRVAVIHGHQLGMPKPEGLRAALPDADIIVYGHTHRPLVDRGDGALVVNPGAAGAVRFGLEPSVAILSFDDGPRIELIDLT